MKNFFNLCISSNIIGVMKSMRTFYNAKKKSAKYKILVGNPVGGKTLRRAMCRSENNYKMNPGCCKQYNIRVSAFQKKFTRAQ